MGGQILFVFIKTNKKINLKYEIRSNGNEYKDQGYY